METTILATSMVDRQGTITMDLIHLEEEAVVDGPMTRTITPETWDKEAPVDGVVPTETPHLAEVSPG